MSMRTYLLDTNICIFLFKGKYNIDKHIDLVGSRNCCISEITAAELLYGSEKASASDKEKRKEALDEFLSMVKILPISPSIRLYAKERARLEADGTPIDDFDLLIGCTAVMHGCIMVTENARHFQRIHGILVENWVRR